MPAWEREHGELPSPNLSLLDRKVGQGLFVLQSPPHSHHARMIEYRVGNDLDLDQVIELYIASTLGERRPITDRPRFAAMLKNANLVITAWDGEVLVGISRSLTDFNYFTYLADLAVRVSHQRKGIGKELVRQTQKHGGAKTHLLLLAAPAAEKYYPHIGFSNDRQAWLLPAGEQIR
jgi:GNAT superfamily N-acetyltransferase